MLSHSLLNGFTTAIATEASLPPMPVRDAAPCAVPLSGAESIIVRGTASAARPLPAAQITFAIGASAAATAATAAPPSSLSAPSSAAPTSATTPRPAAIAAAAAARPLEQCNQIVDRDGAGHGPGWGEVGGSLRRVVALEQRRRRLDPKKGARVRAATP